MFLRGGLGSTYGGRPPAKPCGVYVLSRKMGISLIFARVRTRARPAGGGAPWLPRISHTEKSKASTPIAMASCTAGFAESWTTRGMPQTSLRTLLVSRRLPADVGSEPRALLTLIAKELVIDHWRHPEPSRRRGGIMR